ncbi:membrane protein FAM174 [Lingula anatina]|uniref:Membrane protein FAM174 n=1 Tax=Lingula anatina TaxID=7574 RepID=A0A1S3HDR9_LINAN|nr:membrane protein FAM174 [Lingula anatina]|eukprot:XP_013384175.1 membrane protein FAM174 [Lingula anatina]
MDQFKRTGVLALGTWCLVVVLLLVRIDSASVEGKTAGDRSVGNAAAQNDTLTTTVATPCTNSSGENNTCNSTTTNDTEQVSTGYIWKKINENRAMLQRAFYVLLGVTFIVIVYFGIKYIRVRKAKNKSRKYGVLATSDNMEMRPLEQSDEEDDNTLFEMRSNKR